MTTISDFIIVGCWLVFAIYWFIRAFKTKTIAERQSLASALAHRLPLAFSYVLMAFHRLPSPMNLQLTPRTGWLLAVAGLICVLGLFVTLWARWTLAGNWSSDVTFKQDHELVRSGPYQFVRHPIYTGLLMMCLGTALETGRLRCWLALPVMAVAFWIKLNQEEKLMLQHFPDQYPAYRKQVKAIVPFVI